MKAISATLTMTNTACASRRRMKANIGCACPKNKGPRKAALLAKTTLSLP
jgi:hypothetical protein